MKIVLWILFVVLIKISYGYTHSQGGQSIKSEHISLQEIEPPLMKATEKDNLLNYIDGCPQSLPKRRADKTTNIEHKIHLEDLSKFLQKLERKNTNKKIQNFNKNHSRPLPPTKPFPYKTFLHNTHINNINKKSRVPHRILNVKPDYMFPRISNTSEKNGRKIMITDEDEFDVRSFTNKSVDQNALHHMSRSHTLEYGCGGDFGGVGGLFFSPNYPFNYPPNSKCIYNILVDSNYTIFLDCYDVSVQTGIYKDCDFDAITVFDGEEPRKYCGEAAFTLFSKENTMTIIFESDNIFNYRGFMCRFRAMKSDGTVVEGQMYTNTSSSSDHKNPCSENESFGWSGKCGVSLARSHQRIVGGKEVLMHEFPWMVAIVRECGRGDGYCHICGGTVIHYEWILTGAHCTSSVPKEELGLLLGDHNLYTLTPSQKFLRIAEVYIHPEFNNPLPLNNDIALLQLPQKIAFSSYIAPICLPPVSVLEFIDMLPEVEHPYVPQEEEDDHYDYYYYDYVTEWPIKDEIVHNPLVNRSVSIYGWGITTDSASVSHKLRSVDVTILPNNDCNYYYGVMTPQSFCTSGEGGHGPCVGDSGSPAQLQMVDGRWMQIGVLAFGSAYGCEIGYPSGSALVPIFVDWIKFITGEDFEEFN